MMGSKKKKEERVKKHHVTNDVIRGHEEEEKSKDEDLGVEESVMACESDESARVIKKGKKEEEEEEDNVDDKVDSGNELVEASDEKTEKEENGGGIRKADDFGMENDESAGIVKKGKEKKKKKEKDKKEKDVDGKKNMPDFGNAQAEASDEKTKRKEKKRRKSDEDNLGLQKRVEDSIGSEEGEKDTRKKHKKVPGEEKEEMVQEKASPSKKKGKRVSFSSEVEVFPIGSSDEGEGASKTDLVHGERFTPEEDVAVIEAINKYVQMNQLGEKGIEMVLNCRKYPQLRDCWTEIQAYLPRRPRHAVYHRAHILLQRSELRKWDTEEYEALRRFHEQYGADWKRLAAELGKNRLHVKDAWRRIKLPNWRKGPWSQEEYQSLFYWVNFDLKLKAAVQQNPTRQRLRDNISWEAISQKLSTRQQHRCCLKWYEQLTSPLVREGLWADTDDYWLIGALQKVDAVCVEDVDWDNLLDHRSGEVCQKRWKQMVRHIGGYKERPFIEQLEVLSTRYCTEMLDYRK